MGKGALWLTERGWSYSPEQIKPSLHHLHPCFVFRVPDEANGDTEPHIQLALQSLLFIPTRQWN